VYIKQAVKEFVEGLESARKTTEFPTGIALMDQHVWFSRGNLNIIGGRPSNGKSTFILNTLAVPCAEQGNVVSIYTLEDTRKRFSVRYVANKMGIPNIMLQHNNLTDEQKVKVKEYENEMDDLPMRIIEEYVAGDIDKLEKDLRERTPKPDIVIVDYINKIATRNNSRIETINEYLRRFSNLSKELNFCGIVCCQVNRGSMGEGNDKENVKPPMLHHIKESGDIEQICDVCLFLHYPYKFTENIQDKNDIKIIVAKNKDGDTGKFDLKIQPEFNRIVQSMDGKIDPFQSTF
jgi:replicative DNA helicase